MSTVTAEHVLNGAIGAADSRADAGPISRFFRRLIETIADEAEAVGVKITFDVQVIGESNRQSADVGGAPAEPTSSARPSANRQSEFKKSADRQSASANRQSAGVDWVQVAAVANQIGGYCGDPADPRDRTLVLKLAGLVVTGKVPEAVVMHACDSVRKAHPRKPFAYLHRTVDQQLTTQHGGRLNDFLRNAPFHHGMLK